MDVDIRLLRYFVVVAEEASITAAAERLFVSQPTLTRQIRQLETTLGVDLFVRSHTGMSLTDPGRTLAGHLPALLDGWDTAVRETRQSAAVTAGVLRVGFVATAANESTQRIVAAFTRRHPGWRVDMRRTDWADPTAGLADGRVDAAFLRLPVPDHPRLRVEVLFTEPRWVALPARHRLAGRESIDFPELWDDPFVAGPAEAGRARDHWLATAERDDRAPIIGAVAHNSDEWLAAIANGYGVALAPEGVARFYRRPGITFVPVTGVSGSRVAVGWAEERDGDPVLRDFVRCCIETRSGSR
ncbi:LysR family transcriptional regulator [Rhodococcus sp. NPDC058505]|uniref:LysR family transcriptional regulator n=1 Tax=unclassified Rhodococcus (in: high G+C Gram-positive bacteria) TaxID=192944 RepID=UPI0036631140